MASTMGPQKVSASHLEGVAWSDWRDGRRHVDVESSALECHLTRSCTRKGRKYICSACGGHAAINSPHRVYGHLGFFQDIIRPVHHRRGQFFCGFSDCFLIT